MGYYVGGVVVYFDEVSFECFLELRVWSLGELDLQETGNGILTDLLVVNVVLSHRVCSPLLFPLFRLSWGWFPEVSSHRTSQSYRPALGEAFSSHQSLDLLSPYRMTLSIFVLAYAVGPL